MYEYQDRKSLWQQRQDALSELQSKLTNFRTSVRALSDADELRAYNVTTSDEDKLTAEATNNAFEGNHNVVVNQLANSERTVHTAGFEYAEDYVGAGTFIYSYNHQETTITTTATTTLDDLVGMINNDAENPGVTASLLYYNDRYHLVLNGDDAGTDYKININSSSTETWEADSSLTRNSDNASLTTRITDLDQFSGTLEGGETIEITGTDRNGVALTQVNLSITENTRVEHLIGEINDAFDGIAKAKFENGQIVLADNVSGTSDLSVALNYNANGSAATLTLPSIAVATEGGATSATLANFASSDFTETQSAQDSKIKVDGFPNSSATAEVQTLSFTNASTSGTFNLTYDGQTTDPISYDATTADIQAALETLSNVSAGDITVAGDQLTQTNGTMTFTFADSAGDVDMLSIDPANLSESTRTNYVWAEQTKGSDGYISRSSNTVDDVVTGLTLHLHDTTDATGEEVNLTRDIQSVKTKLDKMVTAYNNAVDFIKENTRYDQATETAGVLMGDYAVSSIQYRLREPLIEQAAGFISDVDSFLTPLSVGFDLDGDGHLSLDHNDLDEAIAEDYRDVLALIGADKTGSSSSNTIEFYSAASSYTTAGEYDVQVTVSGGAITDAQIKLSSESSYRTASFSGNIVTGNSDFDDNGDPVYPENGLQLSVDLSADGVYNATVRVKQGFAGKIEDAIDVMLKPTVGSLVLDQDHVQDQIELLQDKIEDEEYRLGKRENRLVLKFARLEKTLALLQNQMAAANIIPM